jgi:riboflavin biosynthesis pyrimidine reductase
VYDHPDGDVHLVGGPRTIAAFRDLDALDRLGLIVLPRLFGGGTALTPALASDTGLALARHRPLPNGTIELVYDVERRDAPTRLEVAP